MITTVMASLKLGKAPILVSGSVVSSLSFKDVTREEIQEIADTYNVKFISGIDGPVDSQTNTAPFLSSALPLLLIAVGIVKKIKKGSFL